MNWQNLYIFAGGKMLIASVLLMTIGLVRQWYSVHQVTMAAESKRGASGPGFSLRWSLGGRHPVLAAATIFFHGALLVVPFFVSAHGVLFYQACGITIGSFPGWLTDALTLTVLAAGTVLLLRRLVVPDIRYLSSPGDFAVLIVTLLPFVSGYLGYHGMGDDPRLMALHAVSGNLFLVALGWTRLGHFIFFIYSRFLVRGEYSFGSPRRRWYAGPETGRGGAGR